MWKLVLISTKWYIQALISKSDVSLIHLHFWNNVRGTDGVTLIEGGSHCKGLSDEIRLLLVVVLSISGASKHFPHFCASGTYLFLMMERPTMIMKIH